MNLPGACCACLLLAACAPAPRPDLSGTWKMDPARSRLAPGAAAPALWVDTVEHREPEVRVQARRKSPDAFFTFTYATDGSEACNVLDGWMVCSRARWDGSMLRVDSSVKLEKGERQWRETWSLSPDRRTLTVARRGSDEQFIFYERQ